MRLIALPVLAACLTFAGCSVFQKPDGSTATAPSPPKIEQAGHEVAAAAATWIPGPWGVGLGGTILALTTALAAHYRGKEAGWTEATGTPAVAPQSKV